MGKMRTDMSCARVKTYSSAKIGASERHNERKNSDYGNVNVEPERIGMNVHYKSPGERSYMEIFREMEEAGEISRRGLKPDAVLFDEVIFDVNTMYFEEQGGYKFAKAFYAEAYQFACEKYGEKNIISAVMHADEINKAATDAMGYPVYHYHLHVIALPVVEKEIRWSKRCKDPALVGTVKAVIHQISHSKKWESREPLVDDEGKPILRKNGKPKFRASYSVLQDDFYKHMIEHGFTGFVRGKAGSTVEHLSSLQYQIQKDRARLEQIEQDIKAANLRYEPAVAISKTYSEIETAGKKNALTGKFSISEQDYTELTALAKEGITSRSEIGRLNNSIAYYKRQIANLGQALSRMEDRYERLKELCKPYLDALQHFPDLVKAFTERVKSLLAIKRAEEEKAKADVVHQNQRQNPRSGWDR